MKKIMLVYPPSKTIFQRGEERCQSNIDSSTATSLRPCNDLGYCAAVLKNKYDIYLKDYQAYSCEDFFYDIQNQKPDVLFVSVTNGSIIEDLKILDIVKEKNPQISIILKGAIFYNPTDEIFKNLNLSSIDYLLAIEAECTILKLLDAHFGNKEALKNIPNICFKNNDLWTKTNFSVWDEKLDDIPFPERNLMENHLYIRPDTEEMQATITTSRGCPSNCIYCLTPMISGKNLRLRSAENVCEEIIECLEKFHIKNFFFKSDTFTFDRKWTIDLCNKLIEKNLHKKIHWVANSKVNKVDEELLRLMKKAGCWLIAYGFESGSEKTLKNIMKGTTLEQNIEANKLAKKVGLKVYGFYMIGFPWEDYEDLKKTRDLIFKLNNDFLELHISTPFQGTKLFELARKENLIDENIQEKDYFSNPEILGTNYIPIKEIIEFRKKVILRYHLRIRYILPKLIQTIKNPIILKNYMTYGLRLIKNTFKK